MSAEVNSTRSTDTATTRMFALAIFDPSRYDAGDDDGSDSDAIAMSRRNAPPSRMDGGAFSSPLTPAQAQVYHKLIDLADEDGWLRLSNRDLAKALNLSAAYARKYLTIFERSGLIRRSFCDDTTRARTVEILYTSEQMARHPPFWGTIGGAREKAVRIRYGNSRKR